MARTPRPTPAAAAPAPAATPNPTPSPPNNDMKWYTWLPAALLLMIATWWAVDTRYANLYGTAPASIPANAGSPAGTPPISGLPNHVVQTNVTQFHMVKFRVTNKFAGQVDWFPPGKLATNPTTWRIYVGGALAEYPDLSAANAALDEYGLQIVPGPAVNDQHPSTLSGIVAKLERKVSALWNTP